MKQIERHILCVRLIEIFKINVYMRWSLCFSIYVSEKGVFSSSGKKMLKSFVSLLLLVWFGMLPKYAPLYSNTHDLSANMTVWRKLYYSLEKLINIFHASCLNSYPILDILWLPLSNCCSTKYAKINLSTPQNSVIWFVSKLKMLCNMCFLI